jgi:2-polyprenyl-3-methyl-5-hydroxy-6-metoxy-1,4-benzoquinol methylase
LTRPVHFVLPDRSLIESAARHQRTYGLKNYYGKGPVARAKRKRFERSLALGAECEARRVIDMGAADGMLLPSLSSAYEHVAAVDVQPKFADRSQRLVDALGLANVTVTCNENLTFEQLRERIGPGYGLMFLLETMEHVGSQPDMWGSKMAFLHDCFSLLEKEGRIVVSVPKMVGMIILFKNVVQRIFRLGPDKLTFPQVLRSAFLKDTDDLEPLWDGHHVGFNHLKFDLHLERNFVIHRRQESLISVFYVLGRRSD